MTISSLASWPNVEFIRVAANGIDFEVATMGQGDRLALCLHGFPEHAYSWRYQMPLLAEFILSRGQGRVIAESIRRTSRDPARFPNEVIEVYRQNAARPGGLRAMINWYRAAFRYGALGRPRQGTISTIKTPTLFLW